MSMLRFSAHGGSVSKVGIATPMVLIYKGLFSSISTLETPPSDDTLRPRLSHLCPTHVAATSLASSRRRSAASGTFQRGGGAARLWAPWDHGCQSARYQILGEQGAAIRRGAGYAMISTTSRG